MSPWPFRQLQIAFGPKGLQLLRPGRRLTRRGWVREVRLLESVAPAPVAGAAWQPALQALAEALPRVAPGTGRATVVVSSHFVRYALIDPPAGLAGDEEVAWARHALERTYGKVADDWDLRLDPGSGDGPRLACALDGALVTGLRDAFRMAGVALHSLRPHLMAALNDARDFRRQPDAWLALVEADHLCLVLRQHGRLVRVRGLRVADAADAWPRVLAREALLAGLDEVPRDVFIGGDHAGDVGDLPAPWRLHAAAMPVRGPLVMALAG